MVPRRGALKRLTTSGVKIAMADSSLVLPPASNEQLHALVALHRSESSEAAAAILTDEEMV
jgi:hypothetical protein